jgi:hypothetical protein
VAILLLVHVRADVDDLALDLRRVRLLQRVEVIEADHFRAESTLGRACRITERGQRQRLGIRRDDLGVLAAALPERVAHLLGVDLVEAHGLELGHGPGDAARIGGAAGQSRAHFRGQAFDEFVPGVVLHRAVAQLRGRGDGLVRNRGGLVGGMGGKGERKARGERVQTERVAHV